MYLWKICKKKLRKLNLTNNTKKKSLFAHATFASNKIVWLINGKTLMENISDSEVSTQKQQSLIKGLWLFLLYKTTNCKSNQTFSAKIVFLQIDFDCTIAYRNLLFIHSLVNSVITFFVLQKTPQSCVVNITHF